MDEGRTDARSSLRLATFVTEYYEPYSRGNLKPSTVHGYSKLWESLSPRVGEVRLLDFGTVDAANMLAHFASEVGDAVRSNTRSRSLAVFSLTLKTSEYSTGLTPYRAQSFRER